MSLRMHAAPAAAGRTRAAALLLPLLLLATGAATQPEANGLLLSEASNGFEPDGSKCMFAFGMVLGGTPLGTVQAEQPSNCSAACRAEPDCGWFNFCNDQGGCAAVGDAIPALGHRDCLLMDAGNCTLVPPVAQRGSQSDVVGGFPVRVELVDGLPNMTTRTAQGIMGGDFDCDNSMLPGKCAFGSAVLAGTMCANYLSDKCQAVVVYANGTEGCGSGEVAVLKKFNLVPTNAFMSPYVYTLDRVPGAPTGGFLLRSEASLIEGPQPTASAAEPAPAPAPNSTAWMGCLVSKVAALMEGDVVATLSGLESEEACCRACRSDTRSNVWNYCPKPEGCSFTDQSTKVNLTYQQCQLRYQRLVTNSAGGPPYLHVKGEGVGGFTAGAPLAAPAGPEVPGYKRSVGATMFGQPGYACAGSLRPDLADCIVPGTLSQILDHCSSDPVCVAAMYRPMGTLGQRKATGVLRSAEGANATLMLASVWATLYLKQGQAAASDGGGGTSLSTGAIAGIAAGCAVAAVAAAAAGWAVWRQRRRRASASGRTIVPAMPSGKSSCAGSGATAPSAHANGGSGGNGALSPPQGGYRGTLGAQPVAAPGTLVAAAGRQQRSAAAAGSTANGGAPLVLRSALSPRPVLASPFAAQRQARMGSGGLGSPPTPSPFAAYAALPPLAGLPSSPLHSAGGASLATPPSIEERPTSQLGDQELAEMMTELLQYRAAEDAAGVQPCDSAIGASTTPTSGSASLATNGSGVGGTPHAAAAAASQRLGSGALPQSLAAWLIEASAVEYERRPNGEPAVLGEGAGGRVIRANFNGEAVAAKEVDVGKGLQAHEAFITEAQRMQALRHPHIVTLFGLALNPPKGLLVMELCEGRDLGSALQLRNAAGERLFGWWRHGARIAREVASAINYLHAKSLTHMDIKSSNVLLGARGVAKLSDWGSSKRHIEGALSTLNGAVGTFSWMAPEVILGQRCTTQVDIFSFGVLLWEIVTGGKPRRGEMRLPLVPDECPQEVAQLVTDCMALEPADRPNAKQLLQRLAAAPQQRPAGGGAEDAD